MPVRAPAQKSQTTARPLSRPPLRTRLLLAALALLIVCTAAAVLGAPASANTCATGNDYYVDDNFPADIPGQCIYRQLSSVPTLTLSGDTVHIYNGTYTISTDIIGNNVAYIGESESSVILTASTNRPPFTIYGNFASLTNLTLNSSYGSALYVGWNGTARVGGNSATLSHVTLNAAVNSSCVCAGNDTTLSNVTVLSGGTGLQLKGDRARIFDYTFSTGFEFPLSCEGACDTVTWIGGRVGPDSTQVQTDQFYTDIRISGVLFDRAYWAINIDSRVSNSLFRVDNCTFEAWQFIAITDFGYGRLVLEDNTFANSSAQYGVQLFHNETRLAGNTFVNVSYPLDLPTSSTFVQAEVMDVPPTNTVDGGPVYYYLNATGVIVPADAGMVILINVSGATISGLRQGPTGGGILAARTSNVRVADSDIGGGKVAVDWTLGDNLTFTNVTLRGSSTDYGFRFFRATNLTVDGARSDGVAGTADTFLYTVQSADVTVRGVTLNNWTGGVVFEQTARVLVDGAWGTNMNTLVMLLSGTSDAIVRNVTASGALYGVYVTGATRVNVSLVEASTSQWPLSLSYVTTAVVTWFQGTSPVEALMVTDSSALLITRSTFISTANTGARFTRVINMTVIAVNFTGPANPIVVATGSDTFLFAHCNFYGTGLSIVAAGTAVWNLAFPGGGNYYQWAVGAMVDRNHGPLQNISGPDGMSDANYTVRAGQVDAYPLVFVWPPTVRLLSPGSGAAIKPGTVIDMNASDFFDNVTWSDSFDGSGGNLTRPFDLNTTLWADGWHNITVTGLDPQAPTFVVTFSFEIDGTPPTIISVPSMPQGSLALGTVLALSAIDPHLLEMYWVLDGTLQENGMGPFSVDTSSWAPGFHTIDVYAEDTPGNVASESWTFYLDALAPAIALATPSDASFVMPGTVLSFVAYDNFLLTGVDYTLAPLGGGTVVPGSLTPNGLYFEFDTTGLAEGCYGLSLSAKDDAGLTTLLSLGVCVDGTAPDLSALTGLTGPEDRPYIFPGALIVDADPVLNITWLVTPPGAATITLRGLSPSWTFATPETVAVSVSAVDRAGNSASTDYTMLVTDTTPPTVVVAFETEWDELRPIIFMALGTTDNSPSWNSSTSGNFTWRADCGYSNWIAFGPVVTFTFPKPGVCAIELTVKDDAGNAATVRGSLRVLDKTPPVPAIAGPAVINTGGNPMWTAAPSDDAFDVFSFAQWSFTYAGAQRTVTGPVLNFVFNIGGTYTIRGDAADAAGNMASGNFSLHVNTPPTFANAAPLSATQGVAWTWTPSVVDPDAGDPHTFTIDLGPPGMTVLSTGKLDWTPAAITGAVARIPIRFAVSDGEARTTYEFVVEVRAGDALGAYLGAHVPATATVAAGATTLIPIDALPATTGDIDPRTFTYSVAVTGGSAATARVVTLADGTHAILLKGASPGSVTLQVTATDASGHDATSSMTATVTQAAAPQSPGAGGDIVLGLVLGLLVGAAVVFALVRMRRPPQKDGVKQAAEKNDGAVKQPGKARSTGEKSSEISKED